MSERLLAIVDQLRIRPDDRVLEIGCGHRFNGGQTVEVLQYPQGPALA